MEARHANVRQEVWNKNTPPPKDNVSARCLLLGEVRTLAHVARAVDDVRYPLSYGSF